MQLNQATDYAFRVVLHFAALEPETVVPRAILGSDATNSLAISAKNYAFFDAGGNH